MQLGRLIKKLAEKAVDAAFLIKLPAGLTKVAIILHGASCSGKSYVLRWLKRRYKGCDFIEMDQFLFRKVIPDPGIFEFALNLLLDNRVPVNGAKNFVQKIQDADLIRGKEPRHRSMVELLKACLAHDTVIATCGDLPPPHLDNGYYELLGKYTDKTVLHVLVAPESKVLAKRIRMRGRASETDRWLASNQWRLANRKFYDLVLSGTEDTDAILGLIREANAKKWDG